MGVRTRGWISGKLVYLGVVPAPMIYGIFEAAMLICFAASWPFNLTKSYKAGTNVGTSLPFMLIILLGYIFGIANKVVNDDLSYVLAFYVFDLALVSTGVLIYARNARLDRQRASL
jgi:hypothetical protein